MKKIRNYITTYWKKVLCLILDFILCIGLYVATLFVYAKHYSVTIQENYDILTIIWNELVNVATIAPVFGAVFINVLILKIKPQTPGTLRIVWSIMGVGLILFYRVAIAIEMHRVIIASVGLGHFLICIVLTLLSKFQKPRTIYTNSNTLKKIIGNISNKEVLSVQLFELNVIENGDYTNFKLASTDYLVNSNNDVNCILSTIFRLKTSDYEYFKFALDTYEKVVETGQDEYKKKFLQSVNKTILELKRRLQGINPQDVTKEDCCLARLLICYLNLAKLIDNPGYAIVELDDGQLDIDVELEKKIFTVFRSGLLGTILFGSRHIYAFRYKGDGYKTGRKYCTFSIDIKKADQRRTSQKKIVCLIALRENENYDIPYSVMQYIADCEKQIESFFLENTQKGGD